MRSDKGNGRGKRQGETAGGEGEGDGNHGKRSPPRSWHGG